MRYRVEITAAALADAEEAFLWIYRDSPEKAMQWLNAALHAIGSLESYPGRCALAPENDAFEQEIRQLLYGKRSGVYRILFTISGDGVVILHIRHGARRWLKP